MCTRRLPALKASRGPCLERFLSGLPPGTAQHGTTARPGAGVGLPKHGWVLLSPSVPMLGAVDASLGPQALIRAVL